MRKHSSMHCRQQYTKGRFGCIHGMWKEVGKGAPRRGGKVPRAGAEPEVNQTVPGKYLLPPPPPLSFVSTWVYMFA